MSSAHFAAEERLMLDRAYRATEPHLEEHDRLRRTPGD
jgi:hemerythrin